MKKVLFSSIGLLLLSSTPHLSADVTILASEFNQMFSNANPLVVTENTTIELDEDIVINGEPIKTGGNFGQGQENRLIFNAQNGNMVIVEQSGIWQLTTFTSPNHIVQFTGNAELIFESGAIIRFNGGQLIMSNNTRIIPQPPQP